MYTQVFFEKKIRSAESACEINFLSIFLNLILKINIKLLKSTHNLENNKQTNVKVSKHPQCIKTIMSYLNAKKYSTYFKVFAKSKE